MLPNMHFKHQACIVQLECMPQCQVPINEPKQTTSTSLFCKKGKAKVRTPPILSSDCFFILSGIYLRLQIHSTAQQIQHQQNIPEPCKLSKPKYTVVHHYLPPSTRGECRMHCNQTQIYDLRCVLDQLKCIVVLKGLTNSTYTSHGSKQHGPDLSIA
jgi:hypothetical protein